MPETWAARLEPTVRRLVHLHVSLSKYPIMVMSQILSDSEEDSDERSVSTRAHPVRDNPVTHLGRDLDLQWQEAPVWTHFRRASSCVDRGQGA
jgi:hypothetical protein